MVGLTELHGYTSLAGLTNEVIDGLFQGRHFDAMRQAIKTTRDKLAPNPADFSPPQAAAVEMVPTVGIRARA